ncbi:concanavalin A-like lectin/glucanase [Trichodelitschia bisporula]|uniref:Concanavalin A-like lectin/glucanase n=1 Tax=Trichodelitschia bisporula TaxID=703511 RepID=A0A6G1HKX2_9PEZI|nr:concanavalin A-like lectin/glucanase [Trichodelitschia bisporula]
MLASLTLLLTALALITEAKASIADSCTAFKTSGKTPSTFQYHRFYDFRNVTGTLASPAPLDSASPSAQGPASKTVADGQWPKDWYFRDYERKSPGGTVIPVAFTPKRISITKSTDKSHDYETYLSLSTARTADEVQESAEITYKEFQVLHASIRVYARVSGAPGACAGIFTYYNDTQESDIEMMTKDQAGQVHYSNQPSSSGAPDWIDIPGATVNVSLAQHGKKQWTDWHEHRLDWTAGFSAFFVDGVERNTSTLNVPSMASEVYLDMWGANSSWVGPMKVGMDARFDIQWIEMLFNATGPEPQRGYGNVCEVEDKGLTSGSVRLVSDGLASMLAWTMLLIGVVAVVG